MTREAFEEAMKPIGAATEQAVMVWQAATAASEAKYLPVVEKLVEVVNKYAEAKKERSWGKAADKYAEAHRRGEEALAEAAPLLKGE